MRDNRGQVRYLEISCESLELSAKPEEIIEGSFTIQATDKYAEGKIYSSDTRMNLQLLDFQGQEFVVQYFFNAANTEAGSIIRGEFVIISNCGEYTIPFRITIQKPQLECSLGIVKNLFHFTNLAKANWEEAVALFYSPEFCMIIPKNDKNALLSYIGLSRHSGNQQNVEEFLIEVNKKTILEFQFDIEGFILEDVQDSISRTICITRNGWGYTQLRVAVEGKFICIPTDMLTEEEFENNICNFTFYIDASQLHQGMNNGCIVFYNACKIYRIPVDILMEEETQRRTVERMRNQSLLNLTKYYVKMRYGKCTRDQWVDDVAREVEKLRALDEEDVMVQLYQAQVLITRERFNEAKWYLDNLAHWMTGEGIPAVTRCYYLYLTTLFNRDEDYITGVVDEIQSIYANHPQDWWIAWFLMHLEDRYIRSSEYKWQFLEELFQNGCTSPVMFCEAVLLLQENPTFLLRLSTFEEMVLWNGARNHVLHSDLVEQLQYLAARKREYSLLLLRVLCEVYKVSKSPQTVAAICRLLIIGDKKGAAYFEWYALGVAYSVRVTKLYEYYMMSLELDKSGRPKKKGFEIPRMVLMYFAYQSSLNYILNAFLYAYIMRNSEKYSDLVSSYRIAIERFVVDQIRAGHINENLAYLYRRVLVPQMVSGDAAYDFTPLLFMHRIYIEDPRVRNIVVIHEKINGESSYPVGNGVCMIPIYGSEYKLFLQDENGNRFTKSIPFENYQLMEPEKMISYVSGYMQGRLSFDIYLSEIDKNYITITPENVRRFKNLAESPQVVESFKREIRTRLLRFYYDNDMIGELDAFLEDIDAEEMESQERAEFIRFMVSRGMFDKAYVWMRHYGLTGINHKSLARLVSKHITSEQFRCEEFLINVAHYIYVSMKYDENILRYLMLHYEGRTTELRNLWKSAIELELDTKDIMHRILKQISYTGVSVPEKDEILLIYAKYPDRDWALVEALLKESAYGYFVQGAILHRGVFDCMFAEYCQNRLRDRGCKLAILKYASENQDFLEILPRQGVNLLVQELLREDKYFSFYPSLADIVPELHYFRNRFFVEYRTVPETRVCIHYILDDFGDEKLDFRSQEEKQTSAEHYEIQEMREMYEGIYVSAFQLFHGEALQYYITETYAEEGAGVQEHITHSDTIFGDFQSENDRTQTNQEGRFDLLNDIMVGISMQDEATAEQLTEEYLYQDFCARELFHVI